LIVLSLHVSHDSRASTRNAPASACVTRTFRTFSLNRRIVSTGTAREGDCRIFQKISQISQAKPHQTPIQPEK
jgi:hypothetical protein